jgi:hypothetical protein
MTAPGLTPSRRSVSVFDRYGSSVHVSTHATPGEDPAETEALDVRLTVCGPRGESAYLVLSPEQVEELMDRIRRMREGSPVRG